MLYQNISFLTISLFITTSCFSMNDTRKHKLLITEAELKSLPAEIVHHIFYIHLLKHLNILSSFRFYTLKNKTKALLNLMLAHRCGLSKENQTELLSDIQYRLFHGSQYFNWLHDSFDLHYFKRWGIHAKKILEIAIRKVNKNYIFKDYFSHCSEFLFSKKKKVSVRYPIKKDKKWNIQFGEPISGFQPLRYHGDRILIQNTQLQDLSFFGRFLSFTAICIKKVVLNNNQIIKVPVNEFNMLYNMTHLDLSNNQIEEIEELQLNQLTTFYLIGNNLIKLPSCLKLPALKILKASGNKIENIEADAFDNCLFLKTIFLRNNKIKKLKIHFMESLVELYLGNNDIEEIGENIFGPKMNWLSIYNNPKLRLTPDIFKNCGKKLDYISVDSNTFSAEDRKQMKALFNGILIDRN